MDQQQKEDRERFPSSDPEMPPLDDGAFGSDEIVGATDQNMETEDDDTDQTDQTDQE